MTANNFGASLDMLMLLSVHKEKTLTVPRLEKRREREGKSIVFTHLKEKEKNVFEYNNYVEERCIYCTYYFF